MILSFDQSEDHIGVLDLAWVAGAPVRIELADIAYTLNSPATHNENKRTFTHRRRSDSLSPSLSLLSMILFIPKLLIKK